MESSLRDPHAPRSAAWAGLPWSPLAWSLGLHGLLLAAVAPMWVAGESGVPPARLLQARLHAAAPEVVPAPQPVSPRPRDAVLARPKRAADPLLAPAAPVTVVHRAAMPPQPMVPAVPPAPTFVAGPVSPSTGGEAVAVAQPVAPTVALAPAQAAVSLPDAAGLREYRLALAGEARRYRRYPEQARRQGWSGTAEVRIAVSPLQRQAELARSSGHPPLDAAALAMLQQAVAHTPLPSSLHQQQFTLLLPVVFAVED